jgi:hypothetical protein
MHHRLATLLLIALLAGTACGDDTAPREEIEVQAEAILRETEPCVNEAEGYALEYPESWHTTEGEAAFACSIFDDQPIDLTESEEIDPTHLVVIRVLPQEFDPLVATEGFEVTTTTPVTVGDREAVRVYAVATEESGALPAGTVTYRYLVDFDGRTLIASTNDTGGNDPSFPTRRLVLDQMMGTLVFLEAEAEETVPPDVPSPRPPVDD